MTESAQWADLVKCNLVNVLTQILTQPFVFPACKMELKYETGCKKIWLRKQIEIRSWAVENVNVFMSSLRKRNIKVWIFFN